MMCKQMFRAPLLVAMVLMTTQPVVVEAGIRPVQLRCEYRVNPLGIDVVRPRLSWILQSDERGQKQTAYHVLVASSEQKLAADEGDLWDSGKVDSDRTIHVAYAGRSLTSRMRCYWKVRVWDKDGEPSAWSKPGLWMMGLLERSEWQGQWIGARVKAAPSDLAIGYRATEADRGDELKWVQVDLRAARRIDSVRLHPLGYYDPHLGHGVRGVGFPMRFRIDVSADPAFKTFTTIADHTKADYPPRYETHMFKGTGAVGRYVRVTATRLWRNRRADKRRFCFGLAEMEVFSDSSNVALDAAVTAKDSIEARGWGEQYLTDGQSQTGGGESTEPESKHPAVLLRKEAQSGKKLIRATAYICGLGYYELYINGKKVGDHVLDPGWTDYTKRALYVTYDVTNHFKQGSNAICVILGNGWYNLPTPDTWGFHAAPWIAPPKLLLNIDLEFADGMRRTIATDDTWKWSTGPIVYNCVRGGETYDARKEKPGWDKLGYNDSDWKPAKIVPAPAGRLVAQQYPPIRVCESIRPVKLTEPKPGVYVFDLGVNIIGWTRLKTSGKCGQKVTLQFNELLNEDGTVNVRHCSEYTFGRFQIGALFLKGQGVEAYEPRFTYHGFRYVQVTGLTEKPTLDSLTGRWVHTDVEPAGKFSCSNNKINKIQELIVRTHLNSLQGIPTTESIREKLGWDHDDHVTMEAAIFNSDVAAFYTKRLHDVLDAQEPSGQVPPIAPTCGWGKDKPDGSPGPCSDPWWGGTVLRTPWIMYLYCGDRQALEQAYEAMKKYVDYLGTTAKDHIISWQLGDWLEVGRGRPKRTPVAQTATCAYFYWAKILSQTATVLDKQDDAKKYAALAQAIRVSFNKHFLDPATGLYAEDSQTAQVLPLYLGMVPDDKKNLVLDQLVKNITQTRHGHLSTGIVGTLYLMYVLTDSGHAGLAYTIATQEDFPGWWHMIQNGATAIWEAWDGRGTRNQCSLGSIGAWYYQALAGIRPDPTGPGFKKIIIKPEIVGDLTWARGSYNSVHGKIVSDWKIENGTFTLNVTIPPGTTATVYLPTGDSDAVKESGKAARQAEGVSYVGDQHGAAVYRVNSGQYTFTAPY